LKFHRSIERAASEAIDQRFSGKRPLDHDTADFESQRRDMVDYGINLDLARFKPPDIERHRLN